MTQSILIHFISVMYVLFLPGFFLTFIFFKQGNIHNFERFVLSFGLSIAIVPIVVFYTALLGIPITSFTVMLSSTGIIFLTGIFLLILYKKSEL